MATPLWASSLETESKDVAPGSWKRPRRHILVYGLGHIHHVDALPASSATGPPGRRGAGARGRGGAGRGSVLGCSDLGEFGGQFGVGEQALGVEVGENTHEGGAVGIGRGHGRGGRSDR